jgi:glycosyltransferase involved in cell wall biosynthesis
VIWSTFPIATAHWIGLEVSRRSRLPWIAEFRDPMWQSDWPQGAAANAAWRRLEERIFGAVDCAVFTAPGAAQLYLDRYSHLKSSRLAVIENGYDEETFERAETGLPQHDAADLLTRPLTLLHSGIIYRSERDPTHFFAAIAALKRQGRISAGMVQILLRATGGEGDYLAELRRMGIEDIVRLEPPVDYLTALREMLTADGLILLQAANCNAQIPAKLYEYLRAHRPILALTDPQGDTARTLGALRAGRVARLDSTEEIAPALMQFVEDLRVGNATVPSEQAVMRYSRESQTGELADLFHRAVTGGFS